VSTPAFLFFQTIKTKKNSAKPLQLQEGLICGRLQWGDGWPSGKMSDCNARGREFKSWSGQNKFTKVMGSDGKL